MLVTGPAVNGGKLERVARLKVVIHELIKDETIGIILRGVWVCGLLLCARIGWGIACFPFFVRDCTGPASPACGAARVVYRKQWTS